MSDNKLVPIGTVLRLKGAAHNVMVTAYNVVVELADPNDKTNIIEKKYDYMSVLWPEGDVNSESKLFFNHSEIEDIYYYGYLNDESRKFRDSMNKKSD